MNAFRKAVRPLILLLAAMPLSQAAVTWTSIDVPDAIQTGVFGINSTGQMVGFYYDSFSVSHGFLLSEGIFTTIEDHGAGYGPTAATGINDAGQIVGYYSIWDSTSGYLLDGQGFTPINFPGALNTYVMDINNAGQIVGVYQDNRDVWHGFEFSAGNFSTIEPRGADYSSLSAINNLGDIVGDFYKIGGHYHGFAYREGKFITKIVLPGAVNTYATSLNDGRQVVGFALMPSGLDKGFVFFQGTFVGVNFPGSRNTQAWGINHNGDIVGYYYDSPAGNHGFLRTRGTD